MTGTIVNMVAVLIGSFIGLLLRKGLPERFAGALMTGVGLCVLYIGIDGCLAGENMLIAVLSVVVGAALGELLDIDRAVTRLGEAVEKKFRKEDGSGPSLAHGFVSASLLFCIGTMAIVGPLQSGLTGNHETQYIKAILDAISAVVFTATLGAGVLLSSLSVLVYQGSITLLARAVEPYLTEVVVAEMTCVGSLLIIGLALNLLNITKIKVANFLPAILLPCLLCPLFDFFMK
ncbi:MAG: DUF554 domain-containing protein [Clostridia bacterium]|jgi:uncharacterized membrane protein YqgA involved in biofilm formation|nr:DUF554 domain-containing protein [Clostridia bacterium]